MTRHKRGRRRRTPAAGRNQKVTVSMSAPEMEAVTRAAHHRGETVGVWLRHIGVAVATDLKVANGGADALTKQPNKKEGK